LSFNDFVDFDKIGNYKNLKTGENAGRDTFVLTGSEKGSDKSNKSRGGEEV
jgi:hypothetical protein